MARKQPGSLGRRFKQASGLALLVSLSGFSLGGCGDEPSVFPRAPNLGPAPRGGAGAQGGSMDSSAAGVAQQGGMGGAEGGEGPTLGGGTTTKGGSATAGTPSGGTGGGDPNPLCGNAQPDAGEECDDGNRLSGDGCSSQCKSKCEVCESTLAPEYNPVQFSELNWYEECYHDDTPAEGGPAAGVPRSVLCHDLVECVRASGCADIGGPPEVALGAVLTPCWCANEGALTRTGVPDACYDDATIMKGPCYTQLLEASEGDNSSAIASKLTTASRPLGRGFQLLNEFDWLWCKEECLPVTCEEAGGCFVCSMGTCTLERTGKAM